MLNKLKKIEAKRDSKNPFWKILVFTKDLFFRITELLDYLKLSDKKIIKQMMFEVCSPCQNNCKFCTHSGLISNDPDYQLSIEELKKFIYYTHKSGYYIKRLKIHGPGEPTLWKYFNEGIKLLYESNLIKDIIVETNGGFLDRIHNSTWRYISEFFVSIYPESDCRLLKEKQKIYGDKIILNYKERFWKQPSRKYENTIPARCICPGPMFIKDKIFLYCGPPVFNAANLADTNIFENTELYTSIGLNYMDKFDENKMGNLKFCEYCWANANIEKEYVVHSQKGIP